MKEHYEKLKSILGLSFSIAKANFKLRNEGSYLGILWYLLEPLLLFLVIILVKQNMGIIEIVHYPIYLLSGLIMFNFFRSSTMFSTNSIKNNSSFIKSVKVPKEALVISQIMQSVFSHVFEIIVLIILMIFFKVNLIMILFYPFIFLFFVLFVLGVSFILATLGVFISDITNVWNVITRILWFATPIFYMVKKGTRFYSINLFNPISHYINITRSIIIYRTFPSFFIMFVMIIFSLFIFLLGFYVFQKYQNKFAEEL